MRRSHIESRINVCCKLMQTNILTPRSANNNNNNCSSSKGSKGSNNNRRERNPKIHGTRNLPAVQPQLCLLLLHSLLIPCNMLQAIPLPLLLLLLSLSEVAINSSRGWQAGWQKLLQLFVATFHQTASTLTATATAAAAVAATASTAAAATGQNLIYMPRPTTSRSCNKKQPQPASSSPASSPSPASPNTPPAFSPPFLLATALPRLMLLLIACSHPLLHANNVCATRNETIFW